MAGLTDAEVYGNPAQPDPAKTGLTDAEVYGTTTAPGTGDNSAARNGVPSPSASASASGLSDEDVYGTGSSGGLMQYPLAVGSQLAQSAAQAATGPLKGFGAAEARPSPFDTALRIAAKKYPELQPLVAQEPQRATVQEQPLYRAGKATEQAIQGVLPSTTPLNPVVRDIVSGFGSVGGNIAMGMTNPLLGVLSTVGQGMGEAADTAIQKKATPEQQATAAGLGGVAGATDLADMLLPFLGSAGKAASVTRRILTRVGEGAATEGFQEGLQQGIQNLITQKVYKPDQALSEDVVYNALIGGIVGGTVSGAFGGHKVESQATADERAATVTPEMILQSLANMGATPIAPAGVQTATTQTSANEQPAVGTAAGTAPTQIPQAVTNFLDFIRQQNEPQQVVGNPPAPTAPGVRTEADSQTPLMDEIQANPGADLGRMAKLLGPKLYGEPSDLAAVSVKEMMQNGFDAIKTILDQGKEKTGKIDINVDKKARTIAVKDDGSGMTPDVLANQFLQIAATNKEAKNASGGLGIAKMLFLFGNQSVNVTTARDGKVATLVATGEQLFNAMSDKSLAPKVNIRPMNAEDRKMFPKGHGTSVVVRVPETYKSESTGEVRPIDMNAHELYHPVLKNSPLFHNIQVDFNGQPLNIGTRFPSDQYTQLANANFAWGRAKIYISKEAKPQYGQNMHVLSNGLWQFSMNLKKNPNEYDNLPYVIYVDVQPTVRAEDPGYPFDLNRQRFSPTAENDFSRIFNFISVIYQRKEFEDSVKNFGHMEYLHRGRDGTGPVRSSGRIKVEPTQQIEKSPFNDFGVGDKIEVKDGQLYVKGRQVPELTPEDLAKARVNVADLRIAQSDIDPEQPILHDNIDIQVSGKLTPEQALQNIQNALKVTTEEDFLENQAAALYNTQTPQMLPDVVAPVPFDRRSFVELMRERFGQRFDDYMHEIGSAFRDLRKAAVGAINTRIAELGGLPVGTKNYDGLLKEGIGVSFDIEYRGVSIKLPFAGMFINPAATEFRDTIGAAIGMYGTMIHELAHYQVRDHNAAFPAEMQRIAILLETRNQPGTNMPFDIHGFKQRLINAMAANDDINQYMYGVLDGTFGSITARGKRFEDGGGNEARDGSVPGVDAAQLGGGAQSAGTTAGYPGSPSPVGQEPGPPNVSVSVSSVGRGDGDNGAAANRRALGVTAGTGDFSTPQQPEFAPARQAIATLFGGNPPAQVQQQAAWADRINWLYKWWAGLDQLVQVNRNHAPLLGYTETARLSHLEESKIQATMQEALRRWRRLPKKEGDALAGFLDELTRMTYRNPNEVRLAIGRHPTPQEMARLVAKYGISAQTMGPDGVFTLLNNLTQGFITLIANAAILKAQAAPNTTPASVAKAIAQIQTELAAIKARPFFPFMRFGRHFVRVKDATGATVHLETVERRGLRSAEARQTSLFKDLQSRLQPGHTIERGEFPEQMGPLLGMPRMLIDMLKGQSVKFSPDQLTNLPDLTLAAATGLQPILDPRYQRRYYVPGFATIVPGYSMDIKRAFASYFFHGAKYYAKARFGDQLRDYVKQAEQLGLTGNKEAGIARYMRDHLENTILDPKGDFGVFKGLIFLWAMGYVPAAAFQNLTQTPMITFPYLGAKFGEHKATYELVRSMKEFNQFYKRGYYTDPRNPLADWELRALGYAIQTGRITETMAPELAGLAQSNNIASGLSGNTLQRSWLRFQEGAAFLFENAEQVNRRVAFRAALRLAMKNPTAKIINEAVQLHQNELNDLMSNGLQNQPVTMEQARAIIAASYIVDQTQYSYARIFRPRAMRGKVGGTLFVFKKYLQSTLFMLGHNPDVFLRWLLVSALLGGVGGLPFEEDIKSILKAVAWQFFGKNFDLEREAREYILQFTEGKVDPDLILHGLARRGFGIPGALDAMGSLFTGRPGRGLSAPVEENGVKKGFGQNVPFPVFDRSRALSMGMVSPIDFGKLLGPPTDPEKQLVDTAQQASGAIFSVAFNMYKALQDSKTEGIKRWERAMPRAMASGSKALRAFVEGRERGAGGPNSAPTIVNYDPRDPEEMMEIIGLAGGYQPLRAQAKWDSIMAKNEVEKFYEFTRKGLSSQFFEATRGGDPQEIDKVRRAIVDYNTNLPDYAKGMTLTYESLKASMQARTRELNARESGTPVQKSKIGISRAIDQLYPEATIDVRRAPTR